MKNKENFKPIPGCKKYGYDGKTVINLKSEKTLTFKDGKVQVVSDAGKNTALTKEKLKELFPKEAKAPKAKKEKVEGEKFVSIKSQVLEKAATGMSAPDIFAELTAEGVKTNLNSVRWYISQDKNGK